MRNWLIVIPSKQHLILMVGCKELWLHTKNDIYAGPEPTRSGWDGHKLKLVLEDEAARRIAYEWLLNDEFDMSDQSRSLLRLPDSVREEIETHNSIFLRRAS